MNQSPLIGFFTVVVLVALALLFLYLHLRTMRNDAVAYWREILDKLRIRNDMIPNLIGTVRKYSKDSEILVTDLIALRTKSWPHEDPDGHKVDVELRLTQELHKVWQLGHAIPALALDTNFLSLKKDFHDLGREIDEMVDVYNGKVRGFNGRAFFGFKKLQVFEFEG